MAVKLISLGEKFTEDIELDRINWDDENVILLEYVTKYHVDVKTARTSIAKTYEDVNEMAVTLEIPKSDYKNKSFKKLMEWSNLPVQDENFYRDLAINMIIAGENERTILFSHSRITIDVKHNTKADYVTVEIMVKQKEDMFRGVVFGTELSETYNEAKEKILNPVSLNVIVPIVDEESEIIENSEDISENKDSDDKEVKNEIIEKDNKNMILAQIAGLNENASYSADPVNLCTGNFVLSREDFKVNGGFPITFTRFYNSIDNHLGVLGRNWHHNFEIKLKELIRKQKTEDGEKSLDDSKVVNEVSITFDDGHDENYALENGKYIPTGGIFNELSKLDNGHVLVKEDKSKYYFNEKGQLIQIRDRNENEVNLEYKNNLLKMIKTESGYLSLNYSNGKLTDISDHGNRNIKFSYDGNYLSSFLDTENAVYTYKYTKKGILESIVNPRGYKIVENYYDDECRNIKQNFPDGGKMEYEYDDEKLQTILTQQDGSNIVYKRDELYRTTETIYSDGLEKNSYNAVNKVSEKKDKNNNVYKYEYNDKGNILKSIDPLGNKTYFNYDKGENLVRVVFSNGGEEHYIYDNKGNLIEKLTPLKRKTIFEYDKRGNVIKTILPDEGEIQISYDKFGNMSSITNAEGNTVKYEYDSVNRVSKVTDPEGNTTKFLYTLRDKISRVTNAEGKQRIYNYDKSGNVTKIIDFDGSITTYKYNALNKLTELIDPRGGITKYFYDKSWNIYKVIDPLGNETHFSYDDQRRLKSIKDPEGNLTQHSYDGNGNLIEVCYPNGSISRFKYDELNRRIEIKDPKGAKTKLSYDEMSNLIKIEDALSNISEFDYNLEGELISAKDPLGYATKLIYNEMGQVSESIDAKGNSTKYEYNKSGNLYKIIKEDENGNKIVETFEYNKNGQLKEYINPIGATTKYFHDVLGRVIKVKNALEHEVSFKHDAKGNVIEKTDEIGNSTKYNYDFSGNLIEVIDTLGNSTKYSYDLNNNLTSIERAKIISHELAKDEVQKIVTKYNYDKRGLPIKEIDPLGNITSYEYDANGNMILEKNKLGLETLYKYDSLNLLEKITYHDKKTVELEYNALKQLTKMRDWLGENKIELDPMGRINKYIDFRGKVTEHTWNELGEKESIIYPDKSIVNYAYDGLGRLKSVIDDNAVKTSYSYDILGNLSQKTLSNGVSSNYAYDSLNQLTRLTTSKDDEFKDEYNYSYDKLGNKININKFRKNFNEDNFDEGHGEYSYSYDPLNRLTQIKNNGQIQKNFEYDSLGNRIFEENLVGKEYTKKYKYNELNQLLTTNSNIDGKTTYSYDGVGNLEKILNGDGSYKKFTFSSFDRMSRVENSNGDSTNYTYNGFLQRIRSEVDIVNPKVEFPQHKQIDFILDVTKPHNNLLITEGINIPERRFTWGHEFDLISSNVMNKNIIESNLKPDKLFYVQDELFSPARLLDHVGKSKETFSYDEFGISNTPLKNNINYKEFGNVFGFTGYQFEEVSELWYAQARYYDSAISHMLSEDPVKNGLNWYAYCSNNPVNRIDLGGMVDVMVNYIATKNGGKVEEYFSGWGYNPQKKVSIKMNNTTKSYSIGQKDSVVKIVNGKGVIDNNILMKDFGLNYNSSTHQPGDAFDSMNDAAIAWGFMYNRSSINVDLEFGSKIYRDKGKYKYTSITMGIKDRIDIASTIPSGTTLVSAIHSHAAYDTKYQNTVYGGENFSVPDLASSEDAMLPIYLTTSGGKLKRYNPTGKKEYDSSGNRIYTYDKKVSIICSELPKDPHFR